MKIYCECKRRALVFRRIRRGRFKRRLKIFSDTEHSLCYRHYQESLQANLQREMFRKGEANVRREG